MPLYAHKYRDAATSDPLLPRYYKTICARQPVGILKEIMAYYQNFIHNGVAD